MTRGSQATDHVSLVMMKAMRALTKYAAAGIEETGLGTEELRGPEAALKKVGKRAAGLMEPSDSG